MVGDILVAEMTTPDFVPAMKRAAATRSLFFTTSSTI
jgi:phosphoenolpyruvate synthase/pyruvate phosphate dikinase